MCCTVYAVIYKVYKASVHAMVKKQEIKFPTKYGPGMVTHKSSTMPIQSFGSVRDWFCVVSTGGNNLIYTHATVLVLTCTVKLFSLTLHSDPLGSLSIHQGGICLLPLRAAVPFANTHHCCSLRKLDGNIWKKSLNPWQPFGLLTYIALEIWLLCCSFHNLCQDGSLTKPSMSKIIINSIFIGKML